MKISVIIPAKNEEPRIYKVLDAVKKAEVDEIIVVDTSTDNTAKIAESFGARVIKEERPGKGIAIKTGFNASKGDIIVFIDADHETISPEWIKKLVEPIISGEADAVRAHFKRPGTDAPVTKLVAKPMLRILFPEVTHIKSPIEGEIAVRRDILEKIEFTGDWGVDIGLTIDCSLNGYKLIDVDLGFKKHKPSFTNDVEELRDMAEQILRTVLKKAEQYGKLRTNGLFNNF